MHPEIESVSALMMPIQLPPIAERPLVSVIVANRNYADYLGAMIESVLAQTYQRLELIVCDDGSVDDSPAIVRSWAAKDPRVRFLLQGNAGQGAAWNRGFEASAGDVICFLDSDDLFNHQKIETVIQAFKQRPAAGLAIHQLLPISGTGRPMPPAIPWVLSDGWLGPTALRSGGRGSWPTSSAISIRREVADRVFPIPTEFRYSTDTFVCGISQFVTEFVAIPEALGQYRIHGRNASGRLKPSADAVRLDATYNDLTVHHLRLFLAQNFNSQVALSLRREDSSYFYWEQLLGLFVLDHRPAEVFGFSRNELIDHVPRFGLRQFWKVVTRCPSAVGVQLLAMYWAFKPWWGRAKYALLYGRKSSRG